MLRNQALPPLILVASSLGKGGANQSLEQALAKLCQETQNKWIHMLPIALMMVRTVPKWSLLLSSYEMTYGHPFLTSNFFFFFDDDTNTLIKHKLTWEVFNKNSKDMENRSSLDHRKT